MMDKAKSVKRNGAGLPLVAGAALVAIGLGMAVPMWSAQGSRAAADTAAAQVAPPESPALAPSRVQCGTLDAALERLDARMHHGYAAAEGDYLRAERQRLLEARAAARCDRR